MSCTGQSERSAKGGPALLNCLGTLGRVGSTEALKVGRTGRLKADSLSQLQEYLDELPVGPITGSMVVGTLERMLGDCWHLFTGDYGGMTGHKLKNRMEDILWDPPLLTFTIERHGAALLGSTRAELQRWSIDARQGAVSCQESSYRQLHPRSPRLDVDPLAKEVVARIAIQEDHECLKWSKGRRRVTIRTGKIIPAEGMPKQTLIGRRKRLSRALRIRLEEAGWCLVEGTAAHTYERKLESTSPDSTRSEAS